MSIGSREFVEFPPESTDLTFCGFFHMGQNEARTESMRTVTSFNTEAVTI
jgi:hypothetical protein